MTSPEAGGSAQLFHTGAAQASRVLAGWLDRPASVVVERVAEISLAEAMTVLGNDAAPICVCAMQVAGSVRGVLLLVCDDEAGLTLADTVLARPPGSAEEWGDLERSAVLETANIVGCGYLNAFTAGLYGGTAEGVLPSPPAFLRDFPAAVMEAALLAQMPAADSVLLATTEFRIDGVPIRCGLVFLPDAAGLGLVSPASASE